MGRTDARALATRPTLATSRQFLAAAVVIVVVGYAVILWHGWILTRIDWLSLIVAVGALAHAPQARLVVVGTGPEQDRWKKLARGTSSPSRSPQRSATSREANARTALRR